MKQLLLLLVAIPCIAFGQHSEDYLYNHMPNLKQNVSSITELMYDYDEDGVKESDYRQLSTFSINKNKQIEKAGNTTYTFESSSPFFIRYKKVEEKYRRGEYNYKYSVKKSRTGSTVLQKNSDNDEILREFNLDNNNNITAYYEYRNGEKSFRGYLYEYNNRGILIKETHLADDVPWLIITYKLNEFDDVSEKFEFRPDENKYSWKYEFAYTYDHNNNWITKKEIKMSFGDDGKLGNKKSDFGYSETDYTREIEY